MKKRYIVLILLALLIIVIGIGVGVFARKANAGLEQLSGMTLENPDIFTIQDGVYEGSYEVFPVKVVAQVTVKDHRITAIELLEHRQGKGKDAEQLLGRIVDSQSVTLDVISGATYSSKVILKAVERALTQGTP